MLDTTTNAPAILPQQDTGHVSRFAPTPSGRRQITPRWHVVASYPKAERKAHASLHLKGFEAYLPLITVRRPDRSYHTHPLWPGYLFVRLGNQDPWSPIKFAPGVFSLISINGIPVPCPDAVISALRASEHLRATPTPASSLWAPGMPCSLGKPHAMADLPAVITSVQRETAHIAVMMLGQLRTVSVNLDCLTTRDEA